MYTLGSERFLCNVLFSAYAGWLKKSIKVVETRILLVVIGCDGGGEVSNYLQSCCCLTASPWSVLIYPKLNRPTACSIPLNPDINRILKIWCRNILQITSIILNKIPLCISKTQASQKPYSRTTLVHLFLINSLSTSSYTVPLSNLSYFVISSLDLLENIYLRSNNLSCVWFHNYCL